MVFIVFTRLISFINLSPAPGFVNLSVYCDIGKRG
jgi:hypothetical protein